MKRCALDGFVGAVIIGSLSSEIRFEGPLLAKGDRLSSVALPLAAQAVSSVPLNGISSPRALIYMVGNYVFLGRKTCVYPKARCARLAAALRSAAF